MIKKTDQVRHFIATEDFQAALRIASKFRILKSEHKKTLVMAHECFHSPDFYRQLGFNPEEIKQRGITTLKLLWG